MNPFDLPNAVVREAAVLVIFVGLLLLAGIVFSLLRTRSLPGCWNCGFQNVRRSHSHPLLDTFARAFLLYPHRCGKCLARFYCFRSRHLPPQLARRTITVGRTSSSC
jgi:hypothetical protein